MSSAPRWTIVVGTAVVVMLGGALGLVRAVNAGMDGVARVEEVSAVLSPPTDGVENYLLVGSDSREGADPSDPDYANVGSADKNPGRRSDTLMVLRRDTRSGAVALMSVPRDLYVRIGSGRSSTASTPPTGPVPTRSSPRCSGH